MMIDKLTISSKDVLDNIKIEKDSKINHLHVNLDNKIEKNILLSFFEKLSSCDVYNRFHLNLSYFDAENLDIIIEYVKNLKIREFNLNLSNFIIKDEVFENFIIGSLSNKISLEKLHITLDNIDLNENKIKSIVKGLETLPTLNHVYIKINLKSNNLPLEEMTELIKSLDRFTTKEIHF
jgi:hypothetical protein